MSHNHQKKIAVINDFTGFGRCSITVSLPIISYLRVQCCPVPTSIFSNHTGYPEYFFDDYTDKMPEYIKNWKKLDLKFEGIASGYLGSAAQIAMVQEFIKEFKTNRTQIIIDPVMGDHGERYSIYTEEMCQKMKELVHLADIITPNLTEACILTDTVYQEQMSEDQLLSMAENLSNQGAKKVVITGINRIDDIGNFVYEKGKESSLITSHKVGTQRCGTGDVFAAIIAADAVNGVPFTESVKKASEFVRSCILRSIELDIPKTDGVCFEEVLHTLKL